MATGSIICYKLLTTWVTVPCLDSRELKDGLEQLHVKARIPRTDWLPLSTMFAGHGLDFIPLDPFRAF